MAIITTSARHITDNQTTKKRMLECRETEKGIHLIINPSSLNILQTCPKKSFYRLYRELVPEADSPAVIFGSAIHSALETFYGEGRAARILPPNMTKNLDLMAFGGSVPEENDFLVYRATRAFIDRAAPLSMIPDTDKRSVANGVWILGEYFKTYKDDPYIVHKLNGEALIEKHCETVIHKEPGLIISVHGTIDAVMENEANGQILIADHKTSSVVGKDFYNRLKPNHQYTAYRFLARECLGIDTDKFMVNCLQVKSRPKTARGAAPHFPRQITTRTEEDIQEMIEAMVYWGKQYLYWRESKTWPIGPIEACGTYGGCSYLPVCSAPIPLRENILDASFKSNLEMEAGDY